MTAQQLQPLIDDLRAEMEDVYADDVKLHRAWLELDWLESTIETTGDLSLPSTWESAIYHAISNDAFEMISRLLDELGVDIAPLVKHDDKIVLDRGKSEYGVFYVEDAAGSKHIPAQEEFVEKYGIRSVVGFAGELPSGAIFVVILFFNVKVKLKAASLFKTVALSTELGLVPFDGKQIFRQTSEEVG